MDRRHIRESCNTYETSRKMVGAPRRGDRRKTRVTNQWYATAARSASGPYQIYQRFVKVALVDAPCMDVGSIRFFVCKKRKVYGQQRMCETKVRCPMLAMVAVCKTVYACSIPAWTSILKFGCSTMVVRRTVNAGVVGSSPAIRAICKIRTS